MVDDVSVLIMTNCGQKSTQTQNHKNNNQHTHNLKRAQSKFKISNAKTQTFWRYKNKFKIQLWTRFFEKNGCIQLADWLKKNYLKQNP